MLATKAGSAEREKSPQKVMFSFALQIADRNTVFIGNFLTLIIRIRVLRFLNH